MKKIIALKVGAIQTNCYVLYSGNEAVVIDAGGDYEMIKKTLDDNSLVCKYVLLTHGHWDHTAAVARLQQDGAKVILHRADREFPSNPVLSVASLFGADIEAFTPDTLIEGGETLELCGMRFTVLHTPGHTAGSVCYVTDDCIFSGDTLFCRSVGRTDFPTGNEKELGNSLKNVLFKLEGDYTVYPGHDGKTSLAAEKKCNPYV